IRGSGKLEEEFEVDYQPCRYPVGCGSRMTHRPTPKDSFSGSYSKEPSLSTFITHEARVETNQQPCEHDEHNERHNSACIRRKPRSGAGTRPQTTICPTRFCECSVRG